MSLGAGPARTGPGSVPRTAPEGCLGDSQPRLARPRTQAYTNAESMHTCTPIYPQTTHLQTVHAQIHSPLTQCTSTHTPHSLHTQGRSTSTWTHTFSHKHQQAEKCLHPGPAVSRHLSLRLQISPLATHRDAQRSQAPSCRHCPPSPPHKCTHTLWGKAEGHKACSPFPPPPVQTWSGPRASAEWWE